MDLIDKLNKSKQSTGNSAEGVANATPGQQVIQDPTKVDLSRGSDLLKNVGTKSSDTINAANKSNQASADVKPSSSAVEPTGNENAVDKNLEGDWSLDSAYKEIKKLRDENKQYRIKYSEQVDSLKVQMEARQAAKENEMQALIQKAKELDELKAKEEDKKRDLSERLAHREAKVAEYQLMLEQQKKMTDDLKHNYESKLSSYEAEKQAQAKVYEQRLTEELGKIPDKYKDIATLITKGAGDPRDALTALAEARLRGVFEDKTVIVNHGVPGANDGARASKERLDEGARDARSKMSSNQKIKSALESIRSGTPNSAFRTK